MIEELKKEFDKKFGLMKMDNLLQWDWIESKLKKAYIEGSDDCHKSLSSCAGVSLDASPSGAKSEPIEKICKNCNYFQPIKNENGVGWCVFEVGIDQAKFGNETCADFSYT